MCLVGPYVHAVRLSGGVSRWQPLALRRIPPSSRNADAAQRRAHPKRHDDLTQWLRFSKKEALFPAQVPFRGAADAPDRRACRQRQGHRGHVAIRGAVAARPHQPGVPVSSLEASVPKRQDQTGSLCRHGGSAVRSSVWLRRAACRGMGKGIHNRTPQAMGWARKLCWSLLQCINGRAVNVLLIMDSTLRSVVLRGQAQQRTVCCCAAVCNRPHFQCAAHRGGCLRHGQPGCGHPLS